MNISDTEAEDDPVALKDLGNAAFKKKDRRKAIKLYTKALENMPDTPANLEPRRTLLANRGQAYHSFGDIQTSFRDIDLALSPQYTEPDSPKPLTMKCYFRRAKLLFEFMRFEDAKNDFDIVRSLNHELKIDLSKDEVALGDAIDQAVSKRQRDGPSLKERLMRAVDARGLILRLEDRSHFPYPSKELKGPSNDPDDPEAILDFDTDRRVNPTLDMALVPLAYPVRIMAPYFKANPGQGDAPYLARLSDLVPEDVPLSMYLDNLFSSAMMMFPSHLVSDAEHRRYMHKALDHEDPRCSVLMVVTSRGRMVIIPRSATIKDIIAGCKWPREGPMPFQDKRKRPRRRDDPIDGMELSSGAFLYFYVIPTEKLEYHLDMTEKGFKFMNT